MSRLDNWRQGRHSACGMVTHEIPWEEGRSWEYDGDRLRHSSGLFFSVVGIRATTSHEPFGEIYQPMIDQPEIGILGTLVRNEGTGPELLVQAKAEPGNPNRVQLAPTVQATVSNYTRVHGGAATEYLDYFTEPISADVVTDTRQSEQGTRFLGKYNRNVVVQVAGAGPPPASPLWRWWPVADVLHALHRPFLVNTDARSVLVSTDWEVLVDRPPFSRWDHGFGMELRRSYAADRTQAALDALRTTRDATHIEKESMPLEALPGWKLDGWQLTDQTSIAVPMIRVRTQDREVPSWDQPLMRSLTESTATLLCQMREGVLRFWLEESTEIGFAEKVQFGPTTSKAPRGEVVVSCRQADEGGRFDNSITEYSIVMLDPAVDTGDRGVWSTLGEIEDLLQIPGACSNELRSAVSLLLAWL